MSRAFWLIWTVCIVSLLVTVGVYGLVQLVAAHLAVMIVLFPVTVKLDKHLK